MEYSEDSEKVEGRVLLWAPHIYKGSYWAFRNPIQKPHIDEGVVFAPYSDMKKLGIKENDEVIIKINGKEFEVKVKGEDLPANLWLFRGLFYDKEINYALKNGYTVIEDVLVPHKHSI
jgi:hypothetical protein